MGFFALVEKLGVVAPARAQAPAGWTNPAGAGASPAPATLQDLEFVFSKILSLLPALGGLAALVYLIMGGFKFMTAGGDEKALTAARKTLNYAFIGLFISVAAYLFMSSLGRILNLDLLQFEIPR